MLKCPVQKHLGICCTLLLENTWALAPVLFGSTWVDFALSCLKTLETGMCIETAKHAQECQGSNTQAHVAFSFQVEISCSHTALLTLIY